MGKFNTPLPVLASSIADRAFWVFIPSSFCFKRHLVHT